MTIENKEKNMENPVKDSKDKNSPESDPDAFVKNMYKDIGKDLIDAEDKNEKKECVGENQENSLKQKELDEIKELEFEEIQGLKSDLNRALGAIESGAMSDVHDELYHVKQCLNNIFYNDLPDSIKFILENNQSNDKVKVNGLRDLLKDLDFSSEDEDIRIQFDHEENKILSTEIDELRDFLAENIELDEDNSFYYLSTGVYCQLRAMGFDDEAAFFQVFLLFDRRYTLYDIPNPTYLENYVRIKRKITLRELIDKIREWYRNKKRHIRFEKKDTVNHVHYFENYDEKLCFTDRKKHNDEKVGKTAILTGKINFLKKFVGNDKQLNKSEGNIAYQVSVDDNEFSCDFENIKVELKKRSYISGGRYIEDALAGMLHAFNEAGIPTETTFTYPCITIDGDENFELILPQTHKVIGLNDTQRERIMILEKKKLVSTYDFLKKYHEIFLLEGMDDFKKLTISSYVIMSPFYHALRLKGTQRIFPDLILYGPNSAGKSWFSSTFTLLFGYHETITGDALNSNFRNGEFLSEMGFPLVVDDIDGLRDSLFGQLKSSRTGNVEHARGKKDRTMDKYAQITPYILTSNKKEWFEKQEAYLSRAPLIHFTENDVEAKKDFEPIFNDIVNELIGKNEIFANLFYKDVFEIIDAFYQDDLSQLEKLERKLKEIGEVIKTSLEDVGIKVDNRRITFWSWVYIGSVIWREVFTTHGYDVPIFQTILSFDIDDGHPIFPDLIKSIELRGREVDSNLLDVAWGYFHDLVENVRDDTYFDREGIEHTKRSKTKVLQDDYGIYEKDGDYYITMKFIQTYNNYASRNRFTNFKTLREFCEIQNKVLNREDEPQNGTWGKLRNNWCLVMRYNEFSEKFIYNKD